AVGDAAAMIPPLTGNGMSMAFESASLAAPILTRYSSGAILWNQTLRSFAASWRAAFAGRLRWASFLQTLVFNSAGQQLLYLMARLFPRTPHLFFSRTR